MNDYPHQIECAQVTAASASAVIADRISRGPFAPTTAGAAHRTICLVRNGDRLLAWENHGGLTPLPSVLGLMLETTLTTGRFTDTNQSHPGTLPEGDTLEAHHLALDDAKQAVAFDDFVATIGDRLSRAFPIASRNATSSGRAPRSKRWIRTSRG